MSEVGRNEPCPCGSGKKFKRCHGFNEVPAPVAAAPAQEEQAGGADPFGGMDPAWMAGLMEMMKRLPKGQVLKLQSLVQKAMAGKDVTKEMEAFQGSLPPDLQQMIANAPTPPPGSTPDSPPPEKKESRFKSLWKKMGGGKDA